MRVWYGVDVYVDDTHGGCDGDCAGDGDGDRDGAVVALAVTTKVATAVGDCIGAVRLPNREGAGRSMADELRGLKHAWR